MPRSGYERKVMGNLDRRNIPYSYESEILRYNVVKSVKYIPDIILSNGGRVMYIELKGYFRPASRVKFLDTRRALPELDIRIIFQDASNVLYKGSKTTYGQWAGRNGIKWAEGEDVPKAWLEEIGLL